MQYINNLLSKQPSVHVAGPFMIAGGGIVGTCVGARVGGGLGAAGGAVVGAAVGAMAAGQIKKIKVNIHPANGFGFECECY